MGTLPGMAVQVDPIEPMLTAPGTKRLVLKCDEPLSNLAFKCNLRRYHLALIPPLVPASPLLYTEQEVLALQYPPAVSEAGAYTRPLFSST